MVRRVVSPLIIISSLTAAVLAAGCPTSNPPPPGGGGTGGGAGGCSAVTGVRKGVALSPVGFPATWNNLSAFLDDVAGLKLGAVMWNGAWRDSLAQSGAIPEAAKFVVDQGNMRCFAPVPVFGWRSGTTLYLDHPSNATNNWTNASTRAAMQAMLVQYASTYKPPYIFLGNESDFFFESFPADYPNWLSFYNSAYDAIKAASPATLVGAVFQFEHMAGSGALNGWTATHWGALTGHALSKVDVVGLTLYPFFQHANAASVPANYLQPLFDRIGSKPVAITETGWPGETPAGHTTAWNVSETQQVDFIPRLNAMLSGRDVRFVNWLFLNGQVDYCSSCDEWKNFGSISLRNATGVARPVLNSWQAL